MMIVGEVYWTICFNVFFQHFRSTDRGTPRNLDRSTPLWVTSGQHDRSTPRSSSQTVQSLHQPVVHYSQADQIEKTNIVSFQDTIPRPKLIGKHFPVFIRNRLISGGLELVFIHTTMSSIVLYPVFYEYNNLGAKNGFNIIIIHFLSAESCL